MEKRPRSACEFSELVRGDPASGRSFEIRIVPDCEFGFVHGKAGVFRYPAGAATCFMGSAKDSQRAWKENHELVWEDDDPESIQWVQDEFEALWEKGFPIGEHRLYAGQPGRGA